VEKDIEEAVPVNGPLDVLAQVIVSITGIEEWNIDRLFEFLRTCHSFHTLSRWYFDLVVDMLEGRYADTRIRELQPRVSVDRKENSIRGREGVLSLIYHSGGTIPDRGYYGLVLEGSKSKIGELDEEFVWERKVGETFHFGSGTWKIAGIDQRNVEVVPWNRKVQYAPFWKGEKEYRKFHFSQRIGEFLEWAEHNLDHPDFLKDLLSDSSMDMLAAEALILFLREQREKTGASLPHRHHVLIEQFAESNGKDEGLRVVIHVLWGGRVNKPFSIALSAAWEAEFGYPIEVYADDSAVMALLPHEFDTAQLLDMVRAENIEQLLRGRLEQSGFYGARFRENAVRALLLPKGGFNRRMPLWLNRLRSKKLHELVSPEANGFFRDDPLKFCKCNKAAPEYHRTDESRKCCCHHEPGRWCTRDELCFYEHCPSNEQRSSAAEAVVQTDELRYRRHLNSERKHGPCRSSHNKPCSNDFISHDLTV
jgi:ATP-dependent Lhr-like helicase